MALDGTIFQLSVVPAFTGERCDNERLPAVAHIGPFAPPACGINPGARWKTDPSAPVIVK